MLAGVPVREAYAEDGNEGIGGRAELRDGVDMLVGIGGRVGVAIEDEGGPPMLLTALDGALEGGPLGGGGGGAETFSSSGPAFLLTHFPFSLSK